MDKTQLLALDKLSTLTITDLRAASPELYKQAEARVAAERQATVTAAFAGASQELRDVIQGIDFAPGDQPGRDLKQVVFDALAARQVSPEVAKEAAERLLELDRAGMLTDPAEVDTAIADHPLFQRDLEQAAMYKLAAVARLPDDKAARILEHVDSLAVLNDGTLRDLVHDQTLTEDEARELGLAASLYNIADEQVPLAEALRTGDFDSLPHGKLTSTRDLVALSTADWAKAIERAQVTLPEGLDAGAYAAELSSRAAALFPTDALLRRVIPASTAEIAPELERLGPVLERNPTVFGRDFDSLKLDGVPAGELNDLRTAHADLQRIANMHPGLALSAVLNSDQPPAEKARIVAARLALVDRVAKANPDVELLALDYSPDSPDLANLAFDGIDDDERRMVLADFKAYQRAFALTDNVDQAHTILAAGYHSAASIAGSKYDVFQRASGLDEATAKSVYQRARASLAEATIAAATILDVLHGGFDQLQVANLSPSIVNYLKQLDGFSDLFGSQDYCRCEHCQSILGPAAYFVDLMRFVEEHVSEVTFAGARGDHVLHLKTRRPDLWTLPLTCENTDTVIPYLDIINEILENYIAQRTGFAGDLADRGAVEEAVYHQAIATAVDSFKQPFMLPLARVVAYLAHFDRTRAEVARALGAPPAAVAAARLQLTPSEWALITQPNADLAFLQNLYGVPFGLTAGGAIEPIDAQELLRFTGLSRDELGQLGASRFVSAGGAQPFEIRAEKRDDTSVQNDVERIHNLTPDALDRMHRFTRLQRALPWSIPELDLVLAQLAEAGLATSLGDDTLSLLVTVLTVGERWTLPVEQTCALWSTIPRASVADGKPALFDRLFNLPPFSVLGGLLPQDGVRFVHPSFRQTGVPAPADTTLHRLLDGLQLSSDQLAHLIRLLAAPLGADFSTANEDDRGFHLSVANLTLLYRHARLAQLLKLSIDDLFQLIGHAGISGGHIASLGDLTALLEFHDWWTASGYTLPDLATITRAPAAPSPALDTAATAAQIVAEVQSEKALQFADTLFAFLPGVTEAQSRQIIDANRDAVEPAGDGAALRLKASYDPDTPLTIPGGIDVAEPDARGLLLRYHAGSVLPPRIAARLKVSADKVAPLIAMTGVDLADEAISQSLQGGSVAPLVALLDKLLPLATLFKNAAFDGPALEFVRAHPAIFAISDFNAVAAESVRKLSLYVAFADTTSQADFTPARSPLNPEDVRQALAAFDPARKFAAVDPGTLARALRADAALVATLLPHLTLPGTAPEALAALGRAAELAGYLGVGGDTLKLITSDNYGDLQRAADAILSACRAKYPDEQAFLEKLEPYEDGVRARRRDALAEYLIRSIHPEFDTLDELYEHFLVDVKLDGCARTSRLVAAISSVQLYVHRCLMNLEQDRRDPADPERVAVRPEQIPAAEWAWRKNYRVWEANRKVFLYPDHYIEPELRDDKTPLFTDLESTLLQQQIDEQTVLDAYAAYLSGFEEVARLKIAGSYHAFDSASQTDLLHLFGVTPGDPPVYYYRTIENAYYSEVAENRGIVYGPWRKIDVQIPVRRVAPVVYLGRLYVFWVEITTTPKNRVKDGASQFVGYKHRLTLKYTTLRLDGRWTPPQVVSLAGDDFPGGDGIVDDPLAEPAEAEAAQHAAASGSLVGIAQALVRMQTPKYDTRPHPEPLDSYTLTGFQWDQVYPEAQWGALDIAGRNFMMRASVDFYRKAITARRFDLVLPVDSLTVRALLLPEMFGRQMQLLCSRQDNGAWNLYYGQQMVGGRDRYAHATLVADARRLAQVQRSGERPPAGLLSTVGLYAERIAELNERDEIDVINGVYEDAIIDSNGDLLLLQGSVRPGADYLLKRLGTTLGERLARTLFTGGVDALLAIETQQALGEAALPIKLVARIENAANAGTLDFKGSFGTYYREIFFHIPFLLANQLNSRGRFAAAQQWYHYIFNPTASETIALPPGLSPEEQAKRRRDRVWRYREFRNLDIPKLRDMLTDPGAIEIYKKDPFNPHAIARLRLSAYQKSVVMKYIDNLLDWGDSLFSQFTMESVNEATLLYVMAADILGPRPARLGECGEGKVAPRTYETIGPLVKHGSEFLPELETIQIVRGGRFKARPKVKLTQLPVLDAATTRFFKRAVLTTLDDIRVVGGDRVETRDRTGVATGALEHLRVSDGMPVADGGLAHGYGWNDTRTASWTTVKGQAARVVTANSPLITDFERVPNFGWSFIRQLSPVFCVPANPELEEYWDRVEDRLYKIRHCMDIAGVRRQLALFAPEIDPHLLVRARAAGLSIEDVLNATSGNLPPYRFAYLIEKAREYASTVQAFGAALLSALEKRDVEELTRLRTVHQQNLLKLTSQVREWEITMAADAINAVERQQATVQYRRDYYQGLLDNDLLDAERVQQVARHTASVLSAVDSAMHVVAGVGYLVPQLGSPFAMKWGGAEIGHSAEAWARVTKGLVGVAEAVSASAGLEAGFARRREGWEHQVKLADLELNQLEKQLTAATLRHEIAVRSRDIHAKTIEQVEEIYAFYNDRFTNLGLYTWLATTLQRVYREAFTSAYAMARLAEQAFRFERGDDTTPLLQADYWDGARGGLLAGERLLIDLQNMERRFIETNYRTLEIDQSFSLTQVDPAALLQLRETGTCDFAIPELFFDLFYPGHYRRRVRSVRLTIPCVTGPYTNISATLALTGSKMRSEPKLGAALLRDVPLRRSVSIATSTAQNDSGVFEFSFRDERYMPFEGAGAVSAWNLTLPKNFRPFDYQTINDVIIHIGYTAEADGRFRDEVEALNAAVEGTILNFLSNNPLSRVFSLRQDFSSAFNRLLHSPAATPVKIELSEKYLPIFLRGRDVQVTRATLLLRTPREQGTLGGVQLAINGAGQSGFQRDPALGNLWAKDLGALFAPGLLGEHTLTVVNAGDLAPDTLQPGDVSALDADKLLDLMLHVEYTLA